MLILAKMRGSLLTWRPFYPILLSQVRFASNWRFTPRVNICNLIFRFTSTPLWEILPRKVVVLNEWHDAVQLHPVPEHVQFVTRVRRDQRADCLEAT